MNHLSILAAAVLVLSATTTDAASVISISQGKKNSILTDVGGGFGVGPGSAVPYEVPMPTKYKSKNNFALVTVTISCKCPDDVLAIGASIGATPMIPSYSANNLCESDGSYAFRTAQFTLPPESLGGPAVVPGSLLKVTLLSIYGMASIGTPGVTIRVDLGQ